MKHKVVIAITGASGAIYANVLLDKLALLKNQIGSVGIVMSDNAKTVWNFELGNKEYEKLPWQVFSKNDFNAPFASGSARSARGMSGARR